MGVWMCALRHWRAATLFARGEQWYCFWLLATTTLETVGVCTLCVLCVCFHATESKGRRMQHASTSLLDMGDVTPQKGVSP